MILLLDTSTNVCRLTLINDDKVKHESEWEASRELSLGLLEYIETELNKQAKGFSDIKGVGVFRGPGSFTGLRIGLTVLNTLADGMSVPIVGEIGDDWKDQAISRLAQGESDQIVLPFYGGEANITIPRK